MVASVVARSRSVTIGHDFFVMMSSAFLFLFFPFQVIILKNVMVQQTVQISCGLPVSSKIPETCLKKGILFIWGCLFLSSMGFPSLCPYSQLLPYSPKACERTVGIGLNLLSCLSFWVPQELVADFNFQCCFFLFISFLIFLFYLFFRFSTSPIYVEHSCISPFLFHATNIWFCLFAVVIILQFKSNYRKFYIRYFSVSPPPPPHVADLLLETLAQQQQQQQQMMGGAAGQQHTQAHAMMAIPGTMQGHLRSHIPGQVCARASVRFFFFLSPDVPVCLLLLNLPP